MQEVFSKIIGKIKTDSSVKLYGSRNSGNYMIPVDKAIEIVKNAAEECKHGHFGCNSNGQHEKCSTCSDYDCKNRNREWFGVKDEEKKQTNADRIRAMNDEELADFLSENTNCDCCNIQCPDKLNCPSMSSCYCRHLEWLQLEMEE